MMKRWHLGGVILLVLALLTGCISTEKDTVKAEVDKVNTKENVVTYLPTDNADGLVPTTLTLDKGSELPKRAIEGMIALDAKEAYPIIPAGTKILSVVVDPETKVATANFNSTLQDAMKGGSLAEELIANMVVNTLTGIDGIESVRFQIEGHNIDTISGHMDFSRPLKRNEQVIQAKKG